jgi:protein-tyrosine phosphatase
MGLEFKSNVVRILFVCMGNICRSPTAEAVFRRLIADEAAEIVVEVDSAGTHDFHVGHPPDERAQAAARRRGFEMKELRARQLAIEDFDRFDYVLVMDEDNRRDALALAPARFRASVGLLLEYAPDLDVREVPDPYYGGEAGFEHVLDLVEAAARGLIAELRAQQRRT